ncbi:hypothetical protein KY339_01575, partial [Candidatus Woesearchaeota archaeon]|nr:hypothetical protein [Candidatus Woesearchaeota archaeon]
DPEFLGTALYEGYKKNKKGCSEAAWHIFSYKELFNSLCDPGSFGIEVIREVFKINPAHIAMLLWRVTSNRDLFENLSTPGSVGIESMRDFFRKNPGGFSEFLRDVSSYKELLSALSEAQEIILTEEDSDIVKSYSHMTLVKFRKMLEKIKHKKEKSISPVDEQELEAFGKALEELNELAVKLQGTDNAKNMGHTYCFEAVDDARDVLDRHNLKSASICREDFIDDKKIPSKIFGLTDFVYEKSKTEGYSHVYVLTRVADEYFIIDLSAGQFLMKHDGDYRNLGAFVVPLEDLGKDYWPYAMGNISELWQSRRDCFDNRSELYYLVYSNEALHQRILHPEYFSKIVNLFTQIKQKHSLPKVVALVVDSSKRRREYLTSSLREEWSFDRVYEAENQSQANAIIQEQKTNLVLIINNLQNQPLEIIELLPSVTPAPILDIETANDSIRRLLESV